MNLLSVQQLSCSQSAKVLFKNISFGIEQGEKIALIGVNGCGKTTLLTLLTTLKDNPNPAIATKQGLKLTYLPQQPAFNPTDTILDHLFRGDSATTQAIREYQRCLAVMDADPNAPIEKAFEDAIAQMNHLSAWDYEAKVTSILKELDIHHLSQLMSTLSGGMIKKISLAKVFFEETDLLIMDEPTNHLDIKTIEWLETMLSRMNTTLLMVTHDRYFLDKICTKIFEIDQQSLFTYEGNYGTFLEQKEQRALIQQKEEQTIRGILRVELAWLRRGPKARSTKQKARKDRAHDLLNREGLAEEKTLELAVSGRRLGKKILELKHLSHSFAEKNLIQDFSYTFKAGEKIGILGPNGAGKTTLFNIITERLQPQSGEVDRGVNTVFGYFDQHSYAFDLTDSIFDHVKRLGSYITLHDGTQLSAAKLLERFLFPSSSLKTLIGKLSGGERRRLHLVCMLLTNPNFLLFDEPTNDLDITTLSVLEDFLLNFPGCVLVISHDRYFMDRVVDNLLIFKGDGKVSHFPGSYSDYSEALKSMPTSTQKQPVLTKPAEVIKPAAVAPSGPKRQLTNKEREEFKTIEKDITTLETELAELTALFAAGEGSPETFEKAGKRMKDISALLEAKMSRWDELAAFA